jgi:tetratricopeptide (TPR) repeat protein
MEKNVKDGDSHGVVRLPAQDKLGEPARTQLDSHVKDGNDLIEQRRYQEAIANFEQAAAVDRDRPDIYDGWGRALVGLEKYEQARWKFERAIAADKTYVEAYLNAGDVLIELGRHEEAITKYEHATKLDDRRARAWHGWGRALADLAEFDQALRALGESRQALLEQALLKFDRAITLDKDYMRVRLDAGDALFELERYREALSQYDRVIQSQSHVADPPVWVLFSARYNCGRTLVRLEQYPEALANLDAALVLIEGFEKNSPALVEITAATRLEAGTVRAELRHDDEAIEQLVQASDASPRLAVYGRFAIAGILWRQGRYQDAWEQLGRIPEAHERVSTELGPLNANHYVLVGTALRELGTQKDLDDAEKMYRKALELDDHVGARAGLIQVFLRRRADDPENATDWYWQARQECRRAEALIQPELQDAERELQDLEREIQRSKQMADDPLLREKEQLTKERCTSRLLDLATLLLAVDDNEEAKPHLQQAIDLRPDLAAAYANLGVIHERQDNFKEAVAHFQKACKRAPDNLQLRVNLGEAYSRLGLLEKAVEEYQAVLRIAPCNVEAHLGLGEVLTAIGDTGDQDFYAQADSHFTEAMTLHKCMDEPDPKDRSGSTLLTKKQLAAAHYARGYARIQLYEARLGETLFTPWDWQGLMRQAREDFIEAKKDPDHFKAQLAVEKITQRYKRLSSQKVAERWAPLFVAAMAFAILVLVQLSFFARRPAIGLKEEYYVLLTFGSLIFVAAAFYLPQVLKLKVAGVELEKSPVEKVTVPTTLGISRDAFSVKVAALMPSQLAATRPIPRRPEPNPSIPAAMGALARREPDSSRQAAEGARQEIKAESQ